MLQPRLGTERLPEVLNQASRARCKSLQLKEVEFASELSVQLLDFATAMEKLHTQLQTACKDPTNPDKTIQAYLKKLDQKSQWFVKAEARIKAS